MTITDQLNKTITLPAWPPRRIVSLVPSQTELLYDLGLDAEVVGITKFCIHPADWFQKKTRVGGTKTLNGPKIEALHPDLVIGNKEENDQNQVEALATRYPVWMSDVHNLEEAYDMIGRIGQLTGKEKEAQQLIGRIRAEFAERIPALRSDSRRPSVAYFIWRKPYMVAGGDTFIHDMLRIAGFDNVFASAGRYPEISLEELSRTQPEVILLSSEPYPFAPKHLDTFRETCPGARVQLVDGAMFSWYGSRLLHAGKYVQQLRESLNLV
ncbi:MAG: ABC transporter substrate-binding protein [Lewinellaceae bacterium]|nr:ABC transporter substrate-binding protein [Lewinellaceae bacterium]